MGCISTTKGLRKNQRATRSSSQRHKRREFSAVDIFACMVARRSSKIWNISKDDLLVLVEKSSSYKEVLSHFGLENKGNNFKTLRHRMIEDHIDFAHFRTRNEYLKPFQESTPLELILVENSSFNRTHLKNKLLKSGLLINKCYICGQLPEWNGKPLSLQLDHINGISNDNRIENLRMLCPHCHSQTDSFAGKNKNRQVEI
jgi:5-methylcytosine-specific restriction endonuclease McrA